MKRLLAAVGIVAAILIGGHAEAPSAKPQASTWKDPQRPAQSTDAVLLKRWDALLAIAAYSTSKATSNAAKVEALKVGAGLMDLGYCVPQRGRQWEKCRS